MRETLREVIRIIDEFLNKVSNQMKKIILLIIILTPLSLKASEEGKECFKIGESWQDFTLPNDMKNVRWLFGDDKHHTPFMSISFDIDDAVFESWAHSCSVDMKPLGKNKFWDKDIEVKGGGTVSVVRYKNGRYCIGIERTNIPEFEQLVNGKPYFGCPLDGPINY